MLLYVLVDLTHGICAVLDQHTCTVRAHAAHSVILVRTAGIMCNSCPSSILLPCAILKQPVAKN